MIWKFLEGKLDGKLLATMRKYLVPWSSTFKLLFEGEEEEEDECVTDAETKEDVS